MLSQLGLSVREIIRRSIGWRAKRAPIVGTPLVSVIIPTYNRFDYLQNAILSVRHQTYTNYELIVINDRSTDPRYYKADFAADIKVIHLPENSKLQFSHACAGYVRTVGMREAIGEYVAFLDDDDYWLPRKLELQLGTMQHHGCGMSCTEGYIGNGPYQLSQRYQLYNAEFYLETLRKIYRDAGCNALDRNFPTIWNREFLRVHNCVICSSVIVKLDLLQQVGYMDSVENGKEDYDCWKRLIEYTGCAFVKEPCVYYDNSHGDGQNY